MNQAQPNATPAQQVPTHAYRIQDWCRANGVSHTRAYAEIAAGALKTFTIGNRRYISAKASLEYFAALERKAQGKRASK